MGKDKIEKRRRISDQLFQNDSMMAAHIESSQERTVLDFSDKNAKKVKPFLLGTASAKVEKK